MPATIPALAIPDPVPPDGHRVRFVVEPEADAAPGPRYWCDELDEAAELWTHFGHQFALRAVAMRPGFGRDLQARFSDTSGTWGRWEERR